MILCADDFGLSNDVDDAIDELCEAGRLGAVSCMVSLERCTSERCQYLRRHEAKVDLGLHLCLTNEGPSREPILFPPERNLTSLMSNVLLPGNERIDLTLEISRQFQLFAEKFGRPPDYVDGHLHAHQLPVIRRSLVDFVISMQPSHRPYIRNTASRTFDLISAGLPWGKAGLVGYFGGKMEALLTQAEIPTNSGFFGIYNFTNSAHFSDYFPRFVKCSNRVNSILVVHPGSSQSWRREEFEVLRRFDFPPGQINRFARQPAPRRG